MLVAATKTAANRLICRASLKTVVWFNLVTSFIRFATSITVLNDPQYTAKPKFVCCVQKQ